MSNEELQMSKDNGGPSTDQLTGAELWTIGEADHDSDQLVELLVARGIDCLVDVRRIPMSWGRPDYSIKVLPGILAGRSIAYEYMGDRLHGMPRIRGDYLRGGWPNYRAMAKSLDFRKAVDRLADLAEARRTAVFCSEENPRACHRSGLLGPPMAERGYIVIHIRSDGSETRAFVPKSVDEGARQGRLWTGDAEKQRNGHEER